MKLMRLAAILVAAAFVSCCSTTQGTERSNQSEGAIRMRWLPDCGSGRERPYFSIEVRDDGLVRYEGHEGTKVTGTRESRIDTRSARRLKTKAVNFIRERKALEDSEKQFERGYFCLEASVLRSSESVATHARRSDTRSIRSLLQEVGKRIGPEKWACPASRTSSAGLVTTGYCSELPAIALTLAGRRACDVSQDLSVYEDGTIYSLAYRSHGRSDQKDRYYQIDPRAVADLIERIRSLERAALEIIEDPPGRTQKIYYRYKPADIQEIRNRLAGLAPIEWLSTNDAANCEEYPGPSSVIHLREDLDIPSAD